MGDVVPATKFRKPLQIRAWAAAFPQEAQSARPMGQGAMSRFCRGSFLASSDRKATIWSAASRQ